MLRIISMALLLISTFIISNMAEIIPFNAQTTTEILNRLPMHFLPANYVLILWILIYALLGFWIYGVARSRHKTPTNTLNKRTVLFILSSILNILWVLLWHYEFFYWTLLVLIGLLIVVAILYFSYPKNENRFSERIPISIYFSWVIISFFIVIIYMLTLHEWNGWGLSNSLWTVIFLTLLTAISLHFLHHYRDIAFNAVFMWVFIGIAVHNGIDSLFVCTAALFLTAVIGTSFALMKKQPEKA